MKKEYLAKRINCGILIYIIAFIIYSFVGRILPLYMFVGEPVNGYIYILFSITGVGITAADFLCYRYMFQTKYCIVLYAFIMIMLLSSIWNLKYGYVDNLKTIIWTGIQVAVFYSVYRRISKEQMKKFLYGIFCIASFIWTMAILVSLKQFITAASYGVEIWEGEWRLQGFRENRLFGIFNDPNYAAVTSAWVIFMLLYIICMCRRKWIQPFCVTAAVCHGIYIVLSGSRTSGICMLAGSFVYVFLILKNKYSDKKDMVQFIIRIFAAAAVVCLLCATEIGLKKVLPYLPGKYLEYKTEKYVSDNQTVEEAEKELTLQMANSYASVGAENLLEREDVTKENISNNRFKIWRNYIDASKDTFILGASPRNVLRHMKEEYPDIFKKNGDYETHSGFISMYTGTGIIGTAAIFIFIVLIGNRIYRYCFGKQNIEWEFVIIFSILVMIMAYTCFFTELFFVNNLTTALFWILLGSVFCWTDSPVNIHLS